MIFIYLAKEKWVNIDHFKPDPYQKDQFTIIELYDNRDYRLFAMLADVRNYHNNSVISQPKGFPDDCSDIVNKQKEMWDGDGHSYSYLTLKELKDFRKDHKIFPMLYNLIN